MISGVVSMAVPYVTIIILNYNGWEDTRACLESVLSSGYDRLSLIVVDNNSQKDEAAVIGQWLCGIFDVREEISGAGSGEYRAVGYSGTGSRSSDRPHPGEPRAFLLANGENYGFTRGNNLAIEFAFDRLDPDYVMLLNNDVVMEPDTLSRLVDFAETRRDAGSVQPRLLRKEAGGIIDSLGEAVFVNGRAKDIGQGDRDRGAFGDVEVFGACAAAALYRSSALEHAGLLDERFFIMLEDVDIAWRLRLCGYSSYCVSAAVAYHKRGITGTRSIWKGIDLPRSYNKNKNHLFLVLKYYPSGSIFRYLHLNLFRFFAALLTGVVLGRNYPAMLRGVVKERRLTKQKYPNIGDVQERWLLRG
jgi:GT2 family glycosyltransferase